MQVYNQFTFMTLLGGMNKRKAMLSDFLAIYRCFIRQFKNSFEKHVLFNREKK